MNGHSAKISSSHESDSATDALVTPKGTPGNTKQHPSSKMLSSKTGADGLTDAQVSEAKRIFQELDEDGSGSIDHDELKKGLLNLGIQATDAEVSFLLAKADSDGTGSLDFREFKKIIAPSIKLKFSLMSSASAGSLDDEINAALNEEFSRSLKLIREVTAIRKALDKNKYVIDPAGRFMRSWDPVTMLALLFTAIVTPAEIAFAEPALDGLFVLNRLIDLVFLTDMFVQLFLAYADPSQGGRTVKDLTLIRRKYLRGWFVIDLFSVLPLDLVGMTSSSKSVQSVRILRLMRLVRILKMARVLRANRIFQRWECEISIPFATISMLKFGIAIMFWSHWVACFWGMTAAIQDDTAYTWLDQLAANKLGHHTYLFRNGEGEFTSAEKYFISLYWSVYILTSIGLGDITPSNLGEYIVALVLMATSSIFWAYTIGNFCSIISTMDMHTVTFRQRMDELNYMMYDLDIPNDTRKRCRAYFHNSKRLKRVSYYHHLEQELSPELRRETKAHYYLPELKKAWYFGLCGKDFLLNIATVLAPKLYAPMEYLDLPMTLFFNLRGIAAKRGHPMGKGTVWGHDFLLQPEEMFDPCVASALTFVEVLTLARKSIDFIVAEFDDEMEIMLRARRYYLLRNKLMAWASQIMEERNVLSKTTSKLAFGLQKRKQPISPMLSRQLSGENTTMAWDKAPNPSPERRASVLKKIGEGSNSPWFSEEITTATSHSLGTGGNDSNIDVEAAPSSSSVAYFAPPNKDMNKFL